MFAIRHRPRGHGVPTLLAIQIHDILSTPVLEIQAVSYVAVKGRIRPVDYALYVPMLYRVEMDVISMPLEIQFIPDLMLPEPALPDCRFAMLA